MTSPFFTIGHSNRSLAEFVALLRSARVGRVVDIRKMPMSRANPQFNRDALPAVLSEMQIGSSMSRRSTGFAVAGRPCRPRSMASGGTGASTTTPTMHCAMPSLRGWSIFAGRAIGGVAR